VAFINGCSLLILKNIVNDYDIVDPFYKKFKSFTIILGDNSNFIAIVADRNASLNSGKLSLASSNGFFVIDLTNKILYDNYTLSIKGRANEMLAQEPITDVATGV